MDEQQPDQICGIQEHPLQSQKNSWVSYHGIEWGLKIIAAWILNKYVILKRGPIQRIWGPKLTRKGQNGLKGL